MYVWYMKWQINKTGTQMTSECTVHYLKQKSYPKYSALGKNLVFG
jgi:hypothetical protein